MRRSGVRSYGKNILVMARSVIATCREEGGVQRCTVAGQRVLEEKAKRLDHVRKLRSGAEAMWRVVGGDGTRCIERHRGVDDGQGSACLDPRRTALDKARHGRPTVSFAHSPSRDLLLTSPKDARSSHTSIHPSSKLSHRPERHMQNTEYTAHTRRALSPAYPVS